MLGLIAIVALFTVTGTGLVYLSSSHQHWRTQALPLAARIGGLAMLLVNLVLLLNQFQTITAISVWLTQCMLCLILWPYSGALLNIRRKRSAHEQNQQ